MQFLHVNRNLVIGLLLIVAALMLLYLSLQCFNVADEQSYLAELAKTPLTDDAMLSNKLHRWGACGLSILAILTGATGYVAISNWHYERKEQR